MTYQSYTETLEQIVEEFTDEWTGINGDDGRRLPETRRCEADKEGELFIATVLDSNSKILACFLILKPIGLNLK